MLSLYVPDQLQDIELYEVAESASHDKPQKGLSVEHFIKLWRINLE